MRRPRYLETAANASDGVAVKPARAPYWHGALCSVRVHPGWTQNSAISPRQASDDWLPRWLPNMDIAAKKTCNLRPEQDSNLRPTA